MRPTFLFIAFCFSSIRLAAQTRYKDLVFPKYEAGKDLRYAGKRRFDLYQPAHDSAASRPLLIWMHGGGFKLGSRRAAGIRLWCRAYAQRGYVCAAIDYRLGSKNFRFDLDELVEDCSHAVQDVRTAIFNFKANAARWRIDTTRIILAGNSAGGMLALQAVYSSDEELRRLPRTREAARAAGPGKLVGDVGGETAGSIAAILNFWGGIFDTGWLKQARVPIVSVHGSRDKIVPYDHKDYPLYGSLPIHRMADSLGIPNALKTYVGYSHELQRHFFPLFAGRGTRKRWREAGRFTADLLYKTLWK